MSDPIVYGFTRSTFVNIVRMVLTHKEVPYTFRDLEPEMGKPSHLALHPFNRVPILQHGDFVLYETSAIVAYLDETFPRLPLQPKDIPGRARMDQWISIVNSYFYPYMIYHVSHERNVFPELGIPSDEKVVAHALPKIEVALQVAERQLCARQGLSARARADPRRLLSAALHLLVQLRGGSQNDVSEIPCVLPVARTDGRAAGRQEAAGLAATARAHRARARMGHFTSAEILRGWECPEHPSCCCRAATCSGFFGQRPQLQHSAKPMPLLPTVGAIKADLWASRSKAGPSM